MSPMCIVAAVIPLPTRTADAATAANADVHDAAAGARWVEGWMGRGYGSDTEGAS